MATLKERVEGLVGTVTNTDALDASLTAAARIIVDLLPLDKGIEWSADFTAGDGTGITLSILRPIYAHKAYYRARRISAEDKGRAADSGSLFYAVAKDPVWYIEKSKAYVLPGGGTIVGIAYPIVKGTDNKVGGFPHAFEEGVVLYAAIQDLLGKKYVKIGTLEALVLDSISTINAPVAPSFTWSSVSYTNAAYSNASWADALIDSISATTIADFITMPTYTKPTISMTSAPSDFAFSIEVIKPTAPATPSFSWTDATIGTFSATTIGALGTAPNYTKPTVSLPALPADLAFSVDVVIPTVPSAPLFTYSDATIGTYTATTIGSLGTAPTYIKPTISLTAAPADLSFSVEVVKPTPPAAPSFSYTDAVIGTFSATTIGSLGTAPSYTKPTVSLTALPAAFSFSLDVVKPTAPSAPSFTYSDAALGTYTATTVGALGTAPAYTKPTITFTISVPAALDTSLIVAPTAPLAPSIAAVDAVIGTYTATTIGALGTAPTYTKPTTTFSDANAGTYIATEEDFEKANSEIAKQNILIEKFGKDLYNELNEFNQELEVYKTTVQKALEQARLDQERLMIVGRDTTDLNIKNEAQTLIALIKDYELELQLYLGKVDAYGREINTAVIVYTQNLDRYKISADVLLRQYQLDIENEVREFEKENVAYQSSIQTAIENARLAQQRILQQAKDTADIAAQNELQTIAATIKQYEASLEKYSREVTAYSQIVIKEVEEYRLSLERTRIARDSELNQYTLDIQNELNEFQKENAEYQANLQKVVEQARISQEQILALANKTTDLNIQNELQTLAEQVQEYQAMLGKYIEDYDGYSRVVEKEIKLYNENLQKWQTQRQTELSQYQLDIQNELNEFQKDLSIYQSTTQSAIEQARIDQERILALANKTTDLSIQNELQTLAQQVQEYQAKLIRYQNELDAYSRIVEKEVKLFVANIEKWKSDRDTLLQQYALDIQNELNKFQKENVEYQSTVQKAIEQARISQEQILALANKTTDLNIQNEIQTLLEQVQEYQAMLGKYAEDYDGYSRVVEKEIKLFNENLQKWQIQRQTELSQYQLDIQNELNEFNSQLAQYQGDIQKKIEQAKITQERLITQSQMQVELNKFNEQQAIATALANNQQSAVVDIQNKTKALEAAIINSTKSMESDIEEYRAILQKHASDVNNYGVQVNQAVQKLQLYISRNIAGLQAIDTLIASLQQQFNTVMSLLLGTSNQGATQ